MMDIFFKTALASSIIITKAYSTSFSLSVRILHKKYRDPIYAIYGFVRYADEIVDTFHQYDKEFLLFKYKEDTYQAIREGISLNPVLHSFQWVVNKYKIAPSSIEAFLLSMEMDLDRKTYQPEDYKKYIRGSAEAVGLMCLSVFCDGNEEEYQKLLVPARHLASAFQKVNFLRDMRSDYKELGRVYFPGVNFDRFTERDKKRIEQDIENDFKNSLVGIKQLPRDARVGVYLAYVYYVALFKKIMRLSYTKVMSGRTRVANFNKMLLLARGYFLHKWNLII